MAMRARGFTLIETLMVMAIAIILAGLAAPSMRDLITGQAPKNAASDLYSSLVLARSEAIKRNVPVDLVATDDLNWAEGWKVQVPSASNLVIRIQDMHTNVVIDPGASVPKVTYGGNGRLVTSATTFKIRVPGEPNVRMRCISVSPSGRPNVKVDRDSDQAACN